MVRPSRSAGRNRPIGLLSVFTGRDPSGRFFRGYLANYL